MSKQESNDASFHHVAYSVVDIQRTEDFYQWFGFKCFKRWVADDDSLEIRHLSNKDKIVLELFAYKKNTDTDDEHKMLEDDLPRGGIKHIAFKVSDINRYKENLVKQGITSKDTLVKKGRTDILYFFINAPDGNCIEIVQDHRQY